MSIKFNRLVYSVACCMVLLLTAACSGKSSRTVPSPQAIQQLQAQVDQIKPSLPIEAGIGMVMTDIYFDEENYSLNYKYQYTVPGVTVPSDEKIKAAKEGACNMIKALPADLEILKQGVSFHYEYYSKEGEFLYSLDLTKDDL